MSKQIVLFSDLGQEPYRHTWDYQEQLLKQNVAVKSRMRELADGNLDKGDDKDLLETTHHLLFVEHPPVFTLGKSGDPANVLLSEDRLREMGIEFYNTNRGGDITFHGPGQIVGYPILDLERFYTDIGLYLRNLEQVVIETLAEYDIRGERSKGETGVWIDPEKRGRERKICAIGVRSSRWVTMHGFALNVNTNLDYFGMIIPCGIQGKQVTSIAKELKGEIPVEEVKQRLKINFEKIFDVELRSLPAEEKGGEVDTSSAIIR